MSTRALNILRLPNFTAAQQDELATLGLSKIQVEELRKAVRDVSRRLVKPAALNDLRHLLSEVHGTTDKLIRLMECMAPGIDQAHQEAAQILGRTYWDNQEPEDSGIYLADHLIPRLLSLAEAAKNGLDFLPQTPTRHKAAVWQPVRDIHDALFLGWLKTNGHAEAEAYSIESLGEMFAYADEELLELPMPPELRPSASPGCVFRKVVGICYAAAGGTPDPERALKAYVKYMKSESKEFTELFERVIQQLTEESGQNG